MNDSEKIRQQIFDNLNAMSDEELHKKASKTAHYNCVIIAFALLGQLYCNYLCSTVPFAIPMLLTLIFCYLISVIVFCFFSEYTNSISRKIIIFTFCLLNFPFFIICPFIISAYWDLREVIIIAGTFLMVLLAAP